MMNPADIEDSNANENTQSLSRMMRPREAEDPTQQLRDKIAFEKYVDVKDRLDYRKDWAPGTNDQFMRKMGFDDGHLLGLKAKLDTKYDDFVAQQKSKIASEALRATTEAKMAQYSDVSVKLQSIRALEDYVRGSPLVLKSLAFLKHAKEQMGKPTLNTTLKNQLMKPSDDRNESEINITDLIGNTNFESVQIYVRDNKGEKISFSLQYRQAGKDPLEVSRTAIKNCVSTTKWQLSIGQFTPKLVKLFKIDPSGKLPGKFFIIRHGKPTLGDTLYIKSWSTFDLGLHYLVGYARNRYNLAKHKILKQQIKSLKSSSGSIVRKLQTWFDNNPWNDIV